MNTRGIRRAPRTPRRSVAALAVTVCALLVLPCALAQRWATWEQATPEPARFYAPGERVTFRFERTADWDAGGGARRYTGVISVLNEEPGVLRMSRLWLELPGVVLQLWNGSYWQEDGRTYVAPEDWNSTAEPGEARSFLLVAEYRGAYAPPSGFGMTGTVAEPRAEVPPLAPGCPVTARRVALAYWPEPGGQVGFAGGVRLTNLGEVPTTWLVAVDAAGSLEGRWDSASLPAGRGDGLQGGRRHLFMPEAWNGSLEPGAEVTFGFTGRVPAGSEAAEALAEAPLSGAAVDPLFTVDTCPEVGWDGLEDPAVAALRVQWTRLDAEEKRAYAAGRLVWNGTTFTVPSPLSGMRSRQLQQEAEEPEERP